MLKTVLPPRLTVVAAAATGLFLQSCDREPAPAEPAETPVVTPAPAPLQAVTPEPALDRTALLAAVSQAASAYAAGASPSGSDPLVRRTFDVSLPFGCQGAEDPPAEEAGDGTARWSWSPDRKTIRLGLTPGDWTRSALIAGADPVSWEAVEGFWVSRPWMTADGCPALRADPLANDAAAASPETVGLAAVFEEGGSRLGRRNGRAFAYTVRGEGDAPPAMPEDGYRLRLQGRIAAFPDGRAIRCRAVSPRQRPVCVAAVQLDRVAFQTAAGDTLTEWRPG
ncbi:MAG TPA: hypothetical protein VLJ13_03850 [Brevundimonas sp.]|nr:hypothetical protein [Brevundimonas sp.]